MNETRGKCNACRLIYVWSGAPRLRDAVCPKHGIPLRRTSHLHRFDLKFQTPQRFGSRASTLT